MNFEKTVQTIIFELEHFNNITNKITIYTSGTLTFIFLSGSIVFFNHILFDINDKWFFYIIPHYILSLFFLIFNIINFILSTVTFIISLIYKFISQSIFKLLKNYES